MPKDPDSVLALTIAMHPKDKGRQLQAFHSRFWPLLGQIMKNV